MVAQPKIYIASMNMRGKWADPVDPRSLKLNVTSAQGKTNLNRLCFSPMTHENYKGFWNFESYWQSGKVYEDIPEEVTKAYWKNLTEPKRRYPGSKGKKVLYADFGNGVHLDYVSSRKQVYVPEYYNLVRGNSVVDSWIDKFNSGNSITVYDFDGPRNENGEPECIEVTVELLQEKINDVSFPFGHGYVVAGMIKEIHYDEYI